MVRKLLSLLCLFLTVYTAQGTVYYVNGGQPDNTGDGLSWATAKKDLQEAINLALNAGDEVWVKAGMYLPTLDPNGNVPASQNARHKTFYLKTADIKLYGGFFGTETLATQRNPAANVTTLSGDLDGAGGTSDAYHVLLTLSRSNACVIDGFTITGGRADVSTAITVTTHSISIYNMYGGGMYNASGSSPTVSNCVFTYNLASSFGGAIYNTGNSPILSGCSFNANTGNHGGGMYNDNSAPTISNCTFTNNGATLYGGGIRNATATSATVTGCTFTSNTAKEGGGVYNYPTAGTSFSLTDCTFSGNIATDVGGGLANFISNTTISNCSFDGNVAYGTSYGRGGGGMYNVAAPLSLYNCTFTSNTAKEGGGMYNFNGPSMAISSSTFSGNTATGNGGGIFWNLDAGGSITNCILYGNTGSTANRADIYKNGTSNPLTVSYSLIGDYSATGTKNYTSGAGIISGNPLFVDAANPKGADGIFRTADDGLRIGCTSPARNTGTGTTPATDILGTARAGNIDLGAYENVDPSCSNIYYVDAGKPNNNGDGLNWAGAKKDVQEAINLAVNAGDEVWVKAGTYLPTLDPNGGTSNRDRTFYLTQQDIKLYGGFSGTETLATQRNPAVNVTTLSGDLDAVGNNDAYHVVLTIERSNACVIDGFTISSGRASTTGSSFTVNSPNYVLTRSWGGGVYNIYSSPVISNCTIKNNFAWNNGGGICNTTRSVPDIRNCIITNNTVNNNGGGIYNSGAGIALSNSVLSGNTAIAGGGGMYSIGSAANHSTATISNCVVVNNSAVRGGGMYITDYATLNTTNSTFSANTATEANGSGGLQFGVAATPGLGGSSVINCIFYNNIGPTPDKRNLCKNATSGTLNVSYSLIGDYSATATNNYTSGAGIITAEPLFVNAANPAGPDGIFRTADDGLRLLACSPAINSGNGSTPATDILDNSRVGGMDMGAYEYQGSAAIPTLANATVADTRDVTSGSIVMLGNCGDVIASVLPLGTSPVSGNITGKVFLQSTAPTVAQTAYARRHYDLAPVTGADAATAQVTLYFTQADFNDYNTARGTLPPLPVDAADAAGNKSNIRITQEHGTSTTGLPGSYSGWNGVGKAKVLITPTSVVWNAPATRWEVTFPVTGFSGFFLTSSISAPLPVRLLHFTARRVSDVHHKLDWATASEDPGTMFEVERSADGLSFEKIGLVEGKGHAGVYHFDYLEPVKGHNYYRLHIREVSAASLSATALVRGNGAISGNSVTVSPVPATGEVTVRCTNAAWQGQEARLIDLNGRILGQIFLDKEVKLDIQDWKAGVYLLRLPDGSAVRISKQ